MQHIADDPRITAVENYGFPEPREAIKWCSRCGEEIFKEEQYAVISEETVCLHCIEDKLSEFAQLTGIEVTQILENCDIRIEG